MKGSCKFEPFYKVEVFEPSLLAFKPQGKFKTQSQAEAAMPKGGSSRIIRFTDDHKQEIILERNG